jgi:hypothetical protein
MIYIHLLKRKLLEINHCIVSESAKLSINPHAGNRYDILVGEEVILPDATKRTIEKFLHGYQHAVYRSNNLNPLKTLEFVPERRMFLD